jgi:hypothetical protein
MTGTDQSRANIALINTKMDQIAAISVLILDFHLHRLVCYHGLQG